MGPLGPPLPIAEEENEQPKASDVDDAAAAKYPNPIDVDSDATLVSENNESNQPGENHDAGVLLPKTVDTKGVAALDSSNDTSFSPEPPNRPPPIPPRPVPEVDRQKQLIEEVEIGAQQDVTEVINNVLFQSQCAIRPIRVAADGEQVDQIKE
jgi:ubiquitin carboxyl-terminal hydrolase 25/28